MRHRDWRRIDARLGMCLSLHEASLRNVRMLCEGLGNCRVHLAESANTLHRRYLDGPTPDRGGEKGLLHAQDLDNFIRGERKSA